MTVTFSEEDLEKLKLESILNGINYAVANYQAVGIAHVPFVFVLPLDLAHGQDLKRRRRCSLHPRHTNSTELIQFSGFKSSNLGFGIKITSVHSLYFETPRKPSALMTDQQLESNDAPSSTIGTLRNEDLAIGRRLLLRHLITTSWQKESLYLIPTQMMKTAAETCLRALSKWG